jgi:hypothetical protein
VAGLFTFGSIGLLTAALASVKKLSQGLIAAFILAATATYVYNGSILFADIPQSFYILGAAVLSFLAFSCQEKKPGIIILAGLMTGYSGWVKNEGLMFMAICLGITLLIYIFYIRKTNRNFFKYYLPGLLLPLITILFFKAILSPANDLVNPQNLTTIIGKFLDPSRYEVLYSESKIYISTFGGWSISLLLLLLIYLGLTIGKLKQGDVTAFWGITIMVLLQIVGYALIYLITPFDLASHINQSIRRLIIHIYPASLFVLFLATKTPEDIISKLISPLQPKSAGS